MADASNEYCDSPSCDTAEDGPDNGSTAVSERDSLCRAGSQQASPKDWKNAFRGKSSSSSSKTFKRPLLKLKSSPIVPQRSTTASRIPLHNRGDSASAIPSIQRSSGLTEIFKNKAEADNPYLDSDFQDISRYLRVERPKWSKVPRLYTVFRKIGELQILDEIVDQGIDDYWFPFDQHKVAKMLKPGLRDKFLKAQPLVLTRLVDLEKGEKKEHVHFGNGEKLPFEDRGPLGHGRSTTVHKVFSPFSGREFARKRFLRGKGDNPTKIDDFKNELQILKRVDHHHCVELILSYTDNRYVGLIMSPVADCNLLDYYDRVRQDDHLCNVLRGFYGCLASALQYLHVSKIRHRDVKPGNILVKGDCVYLTDFGISLDWQDLPSGTTTEDSGKTWIYCAPEVAANQSRNKSSDVWSLGCVFVEMATISKGRSIDDLRKYLTAATGTYRFYSNIAEVKNWSEILCTCDQEADNVPIAWARAMMQPIPSNRITANDLCADIQRSTNGTKAGVNLFCGACCFMGSDSDSTATSAPGSDIWAKDHADADNQEGAGIGGSPVSVKNLNIDSPTIEITAFPEDLGHSSNPLAGLEDPMATSPPGRKKLIRYPAMFKTRGKDKAGKSQDLEEDCGDDGSAVIPQIAIDQEVTAEVSDAEAPKKDFKGIVSEVSTALQAVRSRRLSSSSDVSAMVKPMLAWIPNNTSDNGLGIDGVDGADSTSSSPRCLPELGPLSWINPSFLVEDIKKDASFMKFLEQNYKDFPDYVSRSDAIGVTFLVMILIKHGLNVESWTYVDSEGASPIFVVLDWGHEYRGVLKMMIRAGASLRYMTKDGSTPLTRAAARGYIWAIDILNEAGASLNSRARRLPLVDAAASGQFETVKHLIIDLHAVPDRRTAKGKTALWAASSNGHVDIVRYLLETFRDQIDIEASFKDKTPLLNAVVRNDVEVARVLLDHHANLNGGKDFKSGNVSYLHHAVRAGNAEMVKLLIEYGADITARTTTLKTVLDEALSQDRTDIKFLLREARTDQERAKQELRRATRNGG